MIKFYPNFSGLPMGLCVQLLLNEGSVNHESSKRRPSPTENYG